MIIKGLFWYEWWIFSSDIPWIYCCNEYDDDDYNDDNGNLNNNDISNNNDDYVDDENINNIK